ncbi:MAG: SAM-dependent methyltransferase [Chloroflexi bacterium]|nr:SAM-dependent methyltransferase [Chloroflexota bacterium]
MSFGIEEPQTEVKRILRRQGRITFAEFMDIALYHPQWGYYNTRSPVGSQGDFFTSPSAHPAFGALLALQCSEMWDVLGRPERFEVLELGAGNGLLCLDLLTFANRALPDFARAVRYTAVERRADVLSRLVVEAGLTRQVEVVESDGAPPGPLTGCILSNELVDALPFHRLVMDGGRLREIYVTLKGDDIAEARDEPSTPALAQRLAEEGVTLGEGWQAEVCLEAEAWVRRIAAVLARGFVVTVDYGDAAHALYSERRRRGTMLCHYQHTLNEEPYKRIGRQDITAHVDFTAIVNAGRAAGLEPLALLRQREFLGNLGLDLFLRQAVTGGLPHRERLANERGMRELVKPGGLGDFWVLAQGKGVGAVELACTRSDNALRQRLTLAGQELFLPLLTPRHMPLLQGSLSSQAGEWMEVWPWGQQQGPGEAERGDDE